MHSQELAALLLACMEMPCTRPPSGHSCVWLRPAPVQPFQRTIACMTHLLPSVLISSIELCTYLMTTRPQMSSTEVLVWGSKEQHMQS